MTNYNEMTDFDINKRVADLSGMKIAKVQDDLRKSVIVWKNDSTYEFDPCNKPSDAWPIILENNISLIAPEGYQAEWDAIVTEYTCFDKNPLRAAMIVFLMLKANKND